MMVTEYDRKPGRGRAPGRACTAVLCALCAVLWGVADAAAALEQLSFFAQPGAVADLAVAGSGSVAVFSGSGDPDGLNGDGNREIMAVMDSGALQQLTVSSGCSNGSPVSGVNAAWVFFESDCDHTGANSDGSFEIFRVSTVPSSPVIEQLTSGSDCSSLSPSVDGQGNGVVFESDCDLDSSTPGLNGDASVEVFFHDPVASSTVQLSDDLGSGTCTSLHPSIDYLGGVVVFDSDCDLAGSNPDNAVEIFSSDVAGNVVQLTVGPDEFCVSEYPVAGSNAAAVAFESDCDHVAANLDGSFEIFSVGGAGVVSQLTDDDEYCSNSDVAVDGSGQVLVWTRDCTPELPAALSQQVMRMDKTEVIALAGGESCYASGATISDDGSRIVFLSDCDGAGGQVEAFLSTGDCGCGTPQSATSSPTAVDALFTLQAAVGSTVCPACECDVDSSGAVMASDALAILRTAVGDLSVGLTCP
ncbi:MAG: hypothetical protein HRT46_11660 [Deltaproteobacteria bacterium]|nr:hypothetical protein [Deltaproteobacteria bacterium]